MKTTFLFLSILLSTHFSFADGTTGSCDGFMLAQKGVTLEYKSYDGKDKLTGSQISTVKNLSESEGVLTVTIHSILKDEKDKVTDENDYTFTCHNGEIKFDMTTMMDKGMAEGMKDMEMTVEQSNLIYPSALVVGQTLPDGSMTMKFSSNGMQIMAMVMNIVDRKVEKLESIETSAGSFSCYKLTQTHKMDMGMMKTETKSIEWLSQGIGVVRSEYFDKEGKLQSYRVLTSITR